MENQINKQPLILPVMSNSQQPNASQTPANMDLLELYRSRVEHEASITWDRNTYFLVVVSLLTIAYTQKPFSNLVQIFIYQLLIATLAIILSAIWLCIQYRSSQYILYYKNKAQALSKSANLPELYPDEIKGYEIRRLVYLLPIAFIAILIATIILQVIFYNPTASTVLPTPTPSTTP
jgi:amino acid transporter